MRHLSQKNCAWPIGRTHQRSSKSLVCTVIVIWTQLLISTKVPFAFLSDPLSISLTSLSGGCILIFPMKSCGPRIPLAHTILTKHHAFAPSSPILLHHNFKFVRVEFCRRHSAKAWETKSGPRVQLFNWSNSRSSHSSLPSREFVRLLNQWISHET